MKRCIADGTGKIIKTNTAASSHLLVMFKKRAGVFYLVQNHEAQPSGFRPDKTRAASFLNGFKNIPGKACVNRVHNNYAFVNVGN